MIFLDIETIGQSDLPGPPDSVLERGMGNRVKPEAIEAKREENRRGWTERAALDWRKAEIIAVGIIKDDEPTVTLAEHLSEAEVLQDFWTYLGMNKGEALCGFNIRAFDLPMLVGRSAVNKVAPSRKPILARYRNDLGVVDLMEELSFWGTFDYAGWGLADYARFFKLETQPFGCGEDITEWYANGDWQSIEKHLTADLKMTADLYHFANGVFFTT